jgi:superfamily II DNA or RNA helicase
MEIQTGQIVKNLDTNEPVTIDAIQDFGDDVSIEFTGVNSQRKGDKIISKEELEQLEIVSEKGAFHFSGDPRKFTLYTEAERIKSAFQFDPLFAVNCSIVDPLPHQVEAVYKYMLPLPRIRFLLADDTGAGKTIMTGLLIKEMILRGLLERILIITPGGLTKQWVEDELGLKFNFQFKLVNRGAFNSDPNIFNNSNMLVTSIDFIRNEDVINVVKDTSWDLVVVDEAHKLSAYEYGTKRYVSKRYEALDVISPLTEHLLLLTATPHRGRKDTFRNLLQLLDKDIFSSDSLVTDRINEEQEKGSNKFFIRRLKEDMKGWNGEPLFKERYTRTVEYKLTPEEKNLYDSVTKYLTQRREEAFSERNIHVSLALMVMQRRLTSSIYAIMRTLNNRYKALNGLVEVLRKFPNLLNKKMQFDFELDSFDDLDELTDEERESMEAILSDPRKFKLFTTAKSIKEVEAEKNIVEGLKELAENLYHQNQEETKLTKLFEFLNDQKVIEGKKLVIFTEHKDTLDYLEKKLKQQLYNVDTIYGQKSVDERRTAQDSFANEGHILVATDAAGEGINLQFCNLLINWDIPWNPNRLEQRMGRIHRYGQAEEVYVFNLVAQNTREGKVMQRLLQKMEIIREQIGSDRVYDVISDIFENVDLDDIIRTTMDGDITDFDIAIDNELTEEKVKEKIKDQKEQLSNSQIDFLDAKKLKEDSDEKRLQPIYIRRFFERSFVSLGGIINENEGFYSLSNVPQSIKDILRRTYNIAYDVESLSFTFDKKLFLDSKRSGKYSKLYYLNPGNPIFDATVKTVLEQFKEEVLKGTILVSPEDSVPYFAYFVKSQITDNRLSDHNNNIADEKLVLVFGDDDNWQYTSPAKLIDLVPPAEYAKKIKAPAPVHEKEIVSWSFKNITNPQFDDARDRISDDIEKRKEYLDEGFSSLIMDYTLELSELNNKLLLGNKKVAEKIKKLEEKIRLLNDRKVVRLQKLDNRMNLNRKAPKVLGCAYVVPLSDVEYKQHYGMKRDTEVERIAIETAMAYEESEGWKCEDVGSQNLGYDLKSADDQLIKRYIEVKGRASDGGVMLSENEMHRLTQLGESAWLYIVINCKSKPELHRINDPGNKLMFEKLTKGIQYFLHPKEWKSKIK